MVFSCGSIPFSDLGFLQQDDNLWVKYTNDRKNIPHFVLSTTINPTSMTFLVKDLINEKTFSSNSYDVIRDFVISTIRENNLKKLLS